MTYGLRFPDGKEMTITDYSGYQWQKGDYLKAGGEEYRVLRITHELDIDNSAYTVVELETEVTEAQLRMAEAAAVMGIGKLK